MQKTDPSQSGYLFQCVGRANGEHADGCDGYNCCWVNAEDTGERYTQACYDALSKTEKGRLVPCDPKSRHNEVEIQLHIEKGDYFTALLVGHSGSFWAGDLTLVFRGTLPHPELHESMRAPRPDPEDPGLPPINGDIGFRVYQVGFPERTITLQYGSHIYGCELTEVKEGGFTLLARTALNRHALRRLTF